MANKTTDGGVASSTEILTLSAGTPIVGTNASDELHGTPDDDLIQGLGGPDYLYGSYGNDTLEGGAGDDQLFGEDGSDVLKGGDGNDSLQDTNYYSNIVVNQFDGGAGNDRIYSNNSYNADVIDGGTGNDTIYFLRATVTGGEGADTFKPLSIYAPATITDFKASEGDKLDLTDLNASLSNYDGSNPFATGHFTFTQVGADVVLTVDRDGTGPVSAQTVLTLQNTDISTITAATLNPGWDPQGNASPGYTIIGTANSEELHGNAGNDLIQGLGGPDYLYGSYGNDTLEGGAGDDQLFGEDGSDVLKGGDGNDSLQDTNYYSNIVVNQFDGGAGNDRIYSNNSYNADVIDGGTGNDTIYFLRATVTGGEGADTFKPLSIYAPATITDFKASEGDKLDLTDLNASLSNYDGSNPFATGHFTFTQVGADVVLTVDRDGTGPVSAQTVLTLQNTDISTITAAALNPGWDPQGNASPGYTIIGTASSEELRGNAGNDLIQGLGGPDYLYGSYGNDTLEGGAGDDQLFGEDGSDVLKGDDGNDSLQDTNYYSNIVVNQFDGGAGNDRIYSYNSYNADVIDGGTGNDTIYFLRATVTGGEGADTFKPLSIYAPATITDFKASEGDKLDLTDLNASLSNYDGSNPFATGHFTFTQLGADVVLTVDRDGTGPVSAQTVLTLQNTDISTITAATLNPGWDPLINLAPVITAPATVSFAENGTGAVLVAAAVDPEGAAITWSLSGADAGLFTLGADGTLAFKSAPDFEAPKDAGGNNVYDVVLTASDGALTASQAVAIKVTDVQENVAPQWVSQGGGIARSNVTPSGGQTNAETDWDAALAPDASKRIAFSTSASNLIAGDTNGAADVFVKNLGTGAIARVSTTASGGQANGSSYGAVFSPDAKKVAFLSDATNLVAGDTNGVTDVFLKDLETGAITRVSIDASGTQGNGASIAKLAFSPDGGKLAIVSSSSNLVGGDSNGAYDIFVKDLATGAVTRVSVTGAGAQANGDSVEPVFSPDGTRIAFTSAASNLVAGDTNGVTDIFVKNLVTGEVTRVSAGPAGAANAESFSPVFSPDGTKIAFVSSASNLVAGDTNGAYDIFLKDLTTGEITRLSTGAAGVQANSDSAAVIFSPDGTKVAFASLADNLVPGDTNGAYDVFVKDLTTGELVRLPVTQGGDYGNSDSLPFAFSKDGTRVLLASASSNLQKGDTNGFTDLFVQVIPTASVSSATLTDDAHATSFTAQGSLFFTDANAGDAHTVAVTAIAGGIGTLTASVVDESIGPDRVAWSYSADKSAIQALGAGEQHVDSFVLTLDDGHGGTITQNVTVTLNGINDAPVVSAPSTHSFAENGTDALRAAGAYDPDGDAISWSLSGADAALFTISPAGLVAFKSAPDFEAPKDAGGNNVYDVVLNASDGQLTTSKAVAITVTNVNEAPVITAAASVAYAENGTGAVLKAAAADPEGSAITWALGGTDAALFTLAPDGTLTFKTAPNYEAPADANHDNVYDLILKAGDGSLVGQKVLSVSVTDVAENTAPPPIIASDTGGTLSGTSGSDIIVGGKGSDVLLGGNGNDTVSGGDGFNMLYGEAGNDTLTGGKDFDQLFGGVGDDTIHGGAGNDMMWGEGGHNTLYGDAGDDQIFAGTDGDWLEGGTGRDMLFGSSGADKFVIGGPNANDADQFFGFTSGSDKVVIHGSDYGLAAGALDAAHFKTGAAATGSAGTFLYNPTLGTLAWDADGAGSAAAVTVATVIGGNLALADLVVV